MPMVGHEGHLWPATLGEIKKAKGFLFKNSRMKFLSHFLLKYSPLYDIILERKYCVQNGVILTSRTNPLWTCTKVRVFSYGRDICCFSPSAVSCVLIWSFSVLLCFLILPYNFILCAIRSSNQWPLWQTHARDLGKLPMWSLCFSNIKI